jgi:hypothetical protein
MGKILNKRQADLDARRKAWNDILDASGTARVFGKRYDALNYRKPGSMRGKRRLVARNKA